MKEDLAEASFSILFGDIWGGEGNDAKNTAVMLSNAREQGLL